MRLSALSRVVVVCAIAGCGGGGGGSAGGAPVSLDAFPATYSKAICEQNFKCSKAEDIGDRTKQDCIDQNTSILTFILPTLRDSQQKGRSSYDAAKMGACISTLSALSCSEWITGLAQPPTCEGAIVPKVAVGGACQQDAECIGGACSGADTAADPPVDGVCKAEIAHGAACAIEDSCVSGEYCDGVCKTKKVSGEACTGSDECGYGCNDETMKCSTYAGCSVAGVTTTTTLFSLLALSIAIALARRKRAAI